MGMIKSPQNNNNIHANMAETKIFAPNTDAVNKPIINKCE
jgi:hypothetical protein